MDTDPHSADDHPTPSGVPFSASTDLTPTSLVDSWWMHTAFTRGYNEFTFAIRLVELAELEPTTLEGPLPDGARVVRRVFMTGRKKQDAAIEFEDALAVLSLESGHLWLGVAAHDPKLAGYVKDTLLDAFPEGGEHTDDEEEPMVRLVVWTDNMAMHNGGHLNRFEVRPWEAVAGNYAPATVVALQPLFEDFTPGEGGKLLLWHGAPGTGKSYALGALSYAWREWCSIHYIADPENFLGDSEYLLTLLGLGTGGGKDWKLVILEDTGELLTADAQSRSGQALSRLLNTTDGMLGQGSNTLFLITTNEPVSSFHEAVARPGRCASLVEFQALPKAKAAEWLLAREPPRRLRASGVWSSEMTLAEDHPQIEEGPWVAAMRRVALVKDGRGLEVDPGIRMVVASLWCQGVSTSASCEGHDDWGCPMPWVDIHAVTPAEGFYAMDPDTRAEWQKESLRMRSVVEDLLADFFGTHGFDPSLSLCLKPMGRWGAARLESRSDNDLDRRAETLASGAAAACRAEMLAFGEWLRERCSGGSEGDHG